MTSVLMVLAPGAEEIEALGVADVLVRAGATLTLASTTAALTLRGSRRLPLAADTTLDAVAGTVFDCLVLPGGMGSAECCQADPRIQALITAQLAAGRWLAAICAAPLALLPGGHARGRRLTCYPSLRDRFTGHATWCDQRVVVDGHLVTSQGPGTALDLGLVLAALLFSPATADEVARGLLVTPVPIPA